MKRLLPLVLRGAAVILKQVGFSISTERPYLAQVEMRADLPDGASRSIYWDIKQDASPYRTLKGKTVSVTNQWQTFTMAITPTFAMDGSGARLAPLALSDVEPLPDGFRIHLQADGQTFSPWFELVAE